MTENRVSYAAVCKRQAEYLELSPEPLDQNDAVALRELARLVEEAERIVKEDSYTARFAQNAAPLICNLAAGFTSTPTAAGDQG